MEENILVVESDSYLTQAIEKTLKELSVKVRCHKSIGPAKDDYFNHRSQLVITNQVLAQEKDLELLRYLRGGERGIPKDAQILILVEKMEKLKPQVSLFSGIELLEKPFSMEQLKSSCQSLLKQSRPQKSAAAKKKKKDKKQNLIALKAGEVLIKEGEVDLNMYLLQQGELLVYSTLEGAVVDLGRIGEGEIVGEMSFMDRLARSASVRALSDCSLVKIPPEKFARVMKGVHPVVKTLIKSLCHRLRETNAKMKISP